MKVIKWTNKYSNETGYVKSISNKEKHFVNTYEKEEAKTYTEASGNKAIDRLINFGEGDNNIFELESM